MPRTTLGGGGGGGGASQLALGLHMCGCCCKDRAHQHCFQVLQILQPHVPKQGERDSSSNIHSQCGLCRQLKDEAMAGLQSLQQAGVDVGDGWVSTNDALLARVWQVSHQIEIQGPGRQRLMTLDVGECHIDGR